MGHPVGIGHHRKMTLKDDNLKSRQDEGFTERRHHKNLTLQEDDITKNDLTKIQEEGLLEDGLYLPS